ncbi:MAG: hypothetical protein HQK49_04975 [Oligoflexia bacterium]|nr:hypothetical protein [Oligoflexia bacterium]
MTKLIIKIISFAILIICIATSTKVTISLLLALTISSLLFVLSKISFKIFLKRISLLIPFLLFLLLFTPNTFLAIFLKSTTAILTTAIITDNFNITTLKYLGQKLHLPSYFIDILAMTFRYSFTLVDEVIALKRNLYLRGSFKKKHLFHSGFLGSLGSLIGNFFIRSNFRAQRLYRSLKIRGY